MLILLESFEIHHNHATFESLKDVMKHLDLFTYTPQEHLVIAQESIASAMTAGLDKVSSMRDKLLEQFPSIMRGFSGSDDLSELTAIPKLSAFEKRFLGNLAKVSYAELRELSADVPEGMIATYAEYLSTLKPVVKHLTQLIPRVLGPYSVYLGTLVSNKQASMSMDDHSSFCRKLEQDRQSHYAEMAKCFSKTGHSASTKVGAVVESNQQWHQVLADLKSISDMLATVNRDQVKSVTRHCEDYLGIIYDNLKEGRMVDVSGEVAKALSTGAYQCATELELFSITYYRVSALTASIESTWTRINAILEE